jgi:hypothetical protein
MTADPTREPPTPPLDAWWESNLRLAEMAVVSGEAMYLRILMLDYAGTTTEILPVLTQDDRHGRDRLRAIVTLAAIAADTQALCSIGVGGRDQPSDRERPADAPLLIIEQTERGSAGTHHRVCVRPIFRDSANRVLGLGAEVNNPAYRPLLRGMLADDRPSQDARDRAAQVLNMLTGAAPVVPPRTLH